MPANIRKSTTLLAPLIRLILQTLTVAQQVRKVTVYYRTRRFIIMLTTACYWTLLYSMQTISYFVNGHFNIISNSRLHVPTGPLPWSFQTEMFLLATFSFSSVCKEFIHPISLSLALSTAWRNKFTLRFGTATEMGGTSVASMGNTGRRGRFSWKTQGKIPSGKPSNRRESNIKTNFKHMGCEGADWCKYGLTLQSHSRLL